MCIRDRFSNIPLLFLSADVTPLDRLDAIKTIKKGNPCIVVSTQCIEAGVDIDMDFVIRDFAPFDSLIQIAGRCNRNGRISRPATVEVVDLSNEQGKRYSDMVYDDVHLQVTRQLIEHIEEIEEKKDKSKKKIKEEDFGLLVDAAAFFREEFKLAVDLAKQHATDQRFLYSIVFPARGG